MHHYDYANWQPLNPTEAASLFENLGAPWWVSGGWAIDLFLGAQTRQHRDLDIGVFRKDQTIVQTHLAERGWELYCADPPGNLRHWNTGEQLSLSIHDVWCRKGPAAPWRIQLMLNERDKSHWVSRRDASVKRSLRDATRLSPEGIPYLAPELQLYFKAKNPLGKDESDFALACPHLSAKSKRWLCSALATTDNAHPWLARL